MRIVNRREFVQHIAKELDITYEQACKAYESVVSMLEHAVINGHKINFGKVGSLVPIRRSPKTVCKGFERLAGGRVKKVRLEYFLGSRIDFKFKVHRAFLRRARLNWL